MEGAHGHPTGIAWMRILMIAQFYPPIIGGEERHVRNLSTALARRGHDVMVATTWQHGLKEYELDEGVAVRRLRGTMQRLDRLFSDASRRYAPPFPDPELTYGLRKLLREHSPDIVHAHNWLLHSYLPLKRARGPGLVITLHDLSLSCVQKNAMRQGEPCDGPATKKCLACAVQFYGPAKGGVAFLGNHVFGALERRAADKFLAVSNAIAVGNGLLEARLPFEIVPNFVSDEIGLARPCDDPRLAQLPSEGYLLFVGDLRRFKGVHVLLEAYARLDKAPPLVLIGRRCPDTPSELPRNVILLESWPHDAVMHAWRNSLFGLAPSVLPDACASVVLEAMAFGKPVVATRIGGMPELVDHEETGLLAAPGDAAGLAAAIRRLLDDDGLRRRMSAAALRKVISFKASSIVPRIERIYSDIVISRRHSERQQGRAPSEDIRNVAGA
jgi:glycosyltransferase involved in cell wall biosynthesis